MTTVIAELGIYGNDLNPDQITSILGLHPTKTWSRGDIRNHRTNAVYDYGCWKLCTRKNNSSLEEHIKVLSQKLGDKSRLISLFASEQGLEVELSVIVNIEEDSPDISLSKDALKWMCILGASIDMDICLYGHN